MGTLDLNRVAVCMSKVIKILNELEYSVKCGDDVYDHKEDFCMLAYMCRVGILDRIENNAYMHNPNLQLRIPTGIFSSRKDTMASALSLTIGRLRELTSYDVVTNHYVEDILNKTGAFFAYDRDLPEKFKQQI